MKRNVQSDCSRCFLIGLKSRMNLLALAGLLAFPLVGAGATTTYTWTGASSADWSTAANWQGGLIAPTGGTYDVIIKANNALNNTLTYTETNGSTLYVNNSGTRCLRIADGADGSMAITGGHLETLGIGDFVGNGVGKSGLLLIDGGTYVSTNGEFLLGANSGLGTLTVNSGSATLGSMRIWCSVGTVNLNGGTLGLGGMSWQTGSAVLNLNGGTLQVSRNTSSWMYSGTNWIVRLNVPTTLDSQGFYATNAAPFIGTGTLTKIGSGGITLNVSNTVEAVTINEGSLMLGGSNTISSGVTLNNGTLGVNHAAALGSSALTIRGGRIQNTSGATVINSLNGPINIYSNFTFAGTRDLNLGTGTATFYKSLVITNTSGTLTFGGNLTDGGSGYDLTVTGSGGMAITGTLDLGGRLTLGGGCTLRLSGANSYTGATTISSGTLIAANSNALGTTNSATSVSAGSKIQLTDGVIIEGETLYLAGGGENWGALQAAANSTSAWNGTIILNELNTAGWSPRLGHKSTGTLIAGGPIIPGAGGTGIHLFISGEPGDGRVIIASTNNTYTGTTGIIRGTLALGADNALPVVTAIDMHPAGSVTADYSKFDLNGFSQVVAKLFQSYATAPLFITNSSDTASVLTVNQTATTTYAGRIDGNVSLIKNGTGSLTLSGTNNAYTGSTTLNSGTLVLGSDGALSPDTSLTISNGTLSAGAWTNTVQQLTVTGTATIDLGDGSGRLAFADSSAQAWTGTLNLTGTFTESAVRFGTSGSGGLTQAQLSQIRVNGQTKWLKLNADGYLIARKGLLICVR